MRSIIVPTLVLLVACSGGRISAPGEQGDSDAGPVDAGAVDAGPVDAGSVDAEGGDAGAPDADAADAALAEPDPVALPCQTLSLFPPAFGTPHGIFDAPFDLTLTTAPKTWVRYTLDGSSPSSVTGTLYRTPIPIATTSVIRAVAFSVDGECSAVRTQTYIRPEHVLTQSNSPGAGWPTEFAASDLEGPYPADYEVDPEVVDHPSYAGMMVPVLLSLPSISLVSDLPNWWDPTTGIYYNAIQKGVMWERPVSIEWIDPAGGAGFSVNAGIRLHGQASRKPHRTPKKTLRVYFRTTYGPGKLTFQFFDDAGGVARFDRILLRNGGNRSWPYWDRDQRREADYVADEWARRAQREMGGLNARGTYAHLYLNGLYWGIYNVTERPDDKFLAAHLGGLETDFDLIKGDEMFDDAPVADAGTIDAYDELLSLLELATVSDSLYAEIAERVDLVDLADFVILTHYIGKTDWPNHNWFAYRKRVGDDTRFKFIAWDNDSGLNKVRENNTLREFPGSPVVIFNRLTTHEAFRALLLERLNLHLGPGGALSPERCAARYRELTDKIDRAVIAESARWGDYTRDVYEWLGATPPKSGPAYLHSRDLPHDYTDPTDIVSDQFQMTWEQVRDEKLNIYCPTRGTVLMEQYRANRWVEAPF